MKKQKLFICIEGLDASGKTTQALRLVTKLCHIGYDAIYTTEPSSGEIGSFLKSDILQRRKRGPAVIEALLFAADRIYHVEQTIKPALQDGKIVVSDRYVFSSLAYQGAAGLEQKWIEEINKWALKPDLSIYLNVTLKVALKRMKQERSVMERLNTQKRVMKVYLQLVQNGRLFPIDGNRTTDAVSRDIFKLVLDKLESSQFSKS